MRALKNYRYARFIALDKLGDASLIGRVWDGLQLGFDGVNAALYARMRQRVEHARERYVYARYVARAKLGDAALTAEIYAELERGVGIDAALDTVRRRHALHTAP